jgi:uncharacterized membrane protein YeaQ/YmgE (transglycosylase-associated protein family)
MPTIAQLIVWIVVGLLGGSLAGRVVKWERHGFGVFRNLGLGLIGALLGGLLFRVSGLLQQWDAVTISLRDVVSAFIGSLLVLLAIWLWRWWKARSGQPEAGG